MSCVISVNKSSSHTFSKIPVGEITLVKGEGVDGDAHCGMTVKHRSRVKADPSQPNLRQVHFIHTELIDELNEKGFKVDPGSMGENVTTKDIDLLVLPKGSLLKIGEQAVVEVTGLRNPCYQLDNFQKGLMSAVLDRDDAGNLVRKAGIMSIVRKGGLISTGDEIQIVYPTGPHHKLEVV